MLKACASVNVKDLLSVMADISVVLADILGKCKAVGDIIGPLTISLGGVIPICINLGFTALIKAFGLSLWSILAFRITSR